MGLDITLNGKPHHYEGETSPTVREFLDRLDLGPQPVLVERNGEALLAREYDAQRMENGDVIEIVRMVAGG